MLLKLKIARENFFTANKKIFKKNPYRYCIQYNICSLEKRKILKGKKNTFQTFEDLSHGRKNSLCVALD